MKGLSFLNRFIPKKKQRIVLYANLGFRDNVKALYDYLVRHHFQEQYEIVCVSNDFYALKRLPGVRYVNLYVGVYYFFTSKYFFYCFGKYPIKPARQQVVVNLWHGMPLKKIGNLIEENQDKDYNYFTYLVATSPFFAEVMQRCFKAQPEQMLLVGNVRNDELTEFPMANRIIWMPTYRNDGKQLETAALGLPFSLSEADFLMLDAELLQQNKQLYIKLHPLEQTPLRLPDNCQAIHLMTDGELSQQGQSLYQFLGTTCALLTDYSSVFLDYLLLDRPIGFTVDDLMSYSQNRGFIFEEMSPFLVGPHITDLSGLLAFVQGIEQDAHRVKRQQLNQQVNTIQTNFCQTLLQQIGLSND